MSSEECCGGPSAGLGPAEAEAALPALPDGLVFRRLEAADYAKGYLELLGQLTTVGPISNDQFAARLKALEERAADYHLYVIEDSSCERVVAAGTLTLELKFIHQCGQIGRVEDIVVDESWRGKNLGKRIILELTMLAKTLDCYKVILNCKESNVPFYEKCGYERNSALMARYFH